MSATKKTLRQILLPIILGVAAILFLTLCLFTGWPFDPIVELSLEVPLKSSQAEFDWLPLDDSFAVKPLWISADLAGIGCFQVVEKEATPAAADGMAQSLHSVETLHTSLDKHHWENFEGLYIATRMNENTWIVTTDPTSYGKPRLLTKCVHLKYIRQY